jgi:hypothetical protein
MVDCSENIKIINKERQIPQGWSWMNMEDLDKRWEVCKKMLTSWSIVALVDGKVEGPGYGLKKTFNPNAIYEIHLGEIFIMKTG